MSNLEKFMSYCVVKEKEMSVNMTPKERHKMCLLALFNNSTNFFQTGPDVLQDTPVATVNEPEDMKRKYCNFHRVRVEKIIDY